MKIQNHWLHRTSVAGFMTVSCSSMALVGVAQEGKAEPKTTAEVIVKTTGEFDIEAMVKKVTEAMEKVEVSDELKKQILAQLKDAPKHKEAIKKQLEAARDQAEAAKEAAMEGAEALKKNLRVRIPQWTTRVVSPLGKDDDDFRIGVALTAALEDKDSDSDKTAAEEKTPGLTVESIMEDSPAAKVGIKSGDRLMTANGTQLSEVGDLKKQIQAAGTEGKQLKIELDRDGKKIQVELMPTKMKAADQLAQRVELTMPSEGFVLDSDAMNRWMQNRARGFAHNGMAITLPDHDADELKKDISELKEEISELKALIQRLIDKK